MGNTGCRAPLEEGTYTRLEIRPTPPNALGGGRGGKEELSLYGRDRNGG